MMIDADFPGGNIIVDCLDGDVAWLRPDLRDTEGSWFYWHFRAREAQGRRIVFRFAENGKPLGVIGALGPAVSRDSGKTWEWLKKAGPGDSSFEYVFGALEKETRFCVAIPYLQADLERFLEKHPFLLKERFCLTEKSREAEKIIFRKNSACRVIFTCRHHACESMANFVLEGILMEADNLDGCEILAFPFMDKDGVEQGDQGKNRRPHDHNRDYGAGGDLYSTVRALKGEGQPVRIAVDLHCPWLYDKAPGWNEKIYQVETSVPSMAAAQRSFAGLLEKEAVSLPYRAANDLPFGTAWNVARPDPEIKNCTEWFATLPGIRLATSVEIPYARAQGEAVTPEKARGFGREMARALAGFILPKGL